MPRARFQVSMLKLQDTQVNRHSLVVIYVIDTRSYSCSLLCFKSHETDCSIAHASALAGLPANGHKADAGKNGQLAETSKQQLDQLFSDHPGLRAKLRSIYETSLDPASLPGKDSGVRVPGRHSMWTEEKGFASALKVLQAQAQDPETTPVDIQAFISFVHNVETMRS